MKIKLLSLLLLIICFSLSSVAKDYVPNNSGSELKTFQGKALIRLNSGINSTTFFKMFENTVSLNKPLIKLENSHAFNQNKREQVQLNKNQNLKDILKAEEPLLRTFKISYTTNETAIEFCKRIKKENPEIEIAEPIYIYTVQQGLPDDLYAAQQDLLYKIKLVSAWTIEEGDSNVVIGISDNGIDNRHEDLVNSIKVNWDDPINGVDDDGNLYIDDFNGYDLSGENNPPSNTYASNDHGTNVAGIAAATVNNGLGIAGVANKCRFFPIKTSVNNQLVYTYESIQYAADNNFQVLNCSWGIEKPFSEIDQSIIDYAVAKDVAIVASGGNTSGSLDKNYPSAYDGILAVGEVNQGDIFSANNFGDYLDILAPGGGNWYTKNNNNYGNNGNGSSYAAPVVAGVVALVRSKYPELTNLQAIELVRQSVVDVSKLNMNLLWEDVLPGRVDAYKAVTTPPFSIPSVRPRKVEFSTADGVVAERFSKGDTVRISIDAFNYLGEAENLNFKLSAVWDDFNTIVVLDSMISIDLVEQNSELTLEHFKFYIADYNSEKMFFRCDITGDDEYNDFFLIEFTPSSIVTNFKNDLISFSASDKGTIGFGGGENNRQGIGFNYKDYGNQLWRAAFIALEHSNKYVTSLYWDLYPGDNCDFRDVKPLIEPNKNIGIFNDFETDFSRRLGIEVKQEFIIPNGNHPIAKVNIEIKNSGENSIIDLAAGYYFDWDIIDSDSNIVELLQDAVPVELLAFPAAVEMVKFISNDYPVFGCGVISFDPVAEVQAAGMNNYSHSIFDDENLYNSLRSGTNIQDVGVFDASTVTGMLFRGNTEPNQIRKFSICFGAADNREDFINKMKRALDTTYTSVKDFNFLQNSLKIYPNPADDVLTVNITSVHASIVSIEIYDMLGRLMKTENRIINSAGNLTFGMDISNLAPANYNVICKVGNDVISKQLVIIK